jgi:hypothetical protein
MGDNKLPKKTDISKADGVIKQSALSAFSVKNPRKYLNTVTPFFSITSPPIFAPSPTLGGATPLPPDLLYVAEGYVVEGYV